MKIGLCIASLLLATGAWAKPLDVLGRWTIEAPEDWWFAETAPRGPLNVATFGMESPEPVKSTPLFVVPGGSVQSGSVVRGGARPNVVRGLSLGIARMRVEQVLTPGAERVEKPLASSLATKAYRREIEGTTGRLILYVWTFPLAKLPGDAGPEAGGRLAVLHIAGRTEEEVERFIKVFETIKPAASVSGGLQ